ncbi:MAG: DNA polymerase III subunit beta [Lentisphaeraceae bacterium]|nr:DNA polymerase III subunit beta [Lentisphaeraceae bacterium]
MSFSIEKSHLQKLVDQAILAVEKSPAVPALSSLLIQVKEDQLRVCATDLISHLTSWTLCEFGSENTDLLVNAKVLKSILAKLPEGVLEIRVDDNYLVHISTGDTRYQVGSLPAEEFPLRSEHEYNNEIEITVGALLGGLIQASIAICNDESRPTLCGTYIHREGDQLKFVATDGRRLSFTSVNALDFGDSENFEALMPAKGVNILKRILKNESIESTVKIKVSGEDIFIFNESWDYHINQIEGVFPNYLQVIPNGETHSVMLPKAVLAQAIERAMVVAEPSGPITLTVKDVGLVVTTEDLLNAFEENILLSEPVESEFKVNFNPDYLLAGLNACPADSIEMKYIKDNEGLSIAQPVVISHGDWSYLIMPMRS